MFGRSRGGGANRSSWEVGEMIVAGAATCVEGVALVLSEFSLTRALARVAQVGSSTRVALVSRVRAREWQRGRESARGERRRGKSERHVNGERERDRERITVERREDQVEYKREKDRSGESGLGTVASSEMGVCV